MKLFCLTLLLLTHAFASDSSKTSSKSDEDNFFSSLKTVEEIQEKAAAAITTFLNSIKEVPDSISYGDNCVYLIEDISQAARLAQIALVFFPFGSEYHQKIKSVFESTTSSEVKLKKAYVKMAKRNKKQKEKALKEKSVEDKNNDRKERLKKKRELNDKYIPQRNQAVKDILEALQSISFPLSSYTWLNRPFYEWLIRLSNFVIEFASKFHLGEDNLSDFTKTMHALMERKAQLDVLASKIDHSNN